jgi:hypothetical protein
VSEKEATARIKINKLLEAAGWRFFPDGNAPANIRLEPGVTIKSADLDALGDNCASPNFPGTTFTPDSLLTRSQPDWCRSTSRITLH